MVLARHSGAAVTSLGTTQVRVEIESLSTGVDLSEPLTRARFEELNNDLFKKTLTPVRKARSSVYHCAPKIAALQ